MQTAIVTATVVGIAIGACLAQTVNKLRPPRPKTPPTTPTPDLVRKRQQLKALESFKDWSNYMLVTTVATLAWLLSKDTTVVSATSSAGKIAIILLCASMVFAIFTLALIPIIAQAITGSTDTFYEVTGTFKLLPMVGPTIALPIKAVCWLQHVFFMGGVLTYAGAVLLAPHVEGAPKPAPSSTITAPSGSLGNEAPLALTEISSALLTPTIAALGLYIAWQQWQTNRNKLKLDLFRKRFAIYNAAVSLINSILRSGQVSADARYKFINKTRSANFVVGEQIMTYLDDELLKRVVWLETLQSELDSSVTGPARVGNVRQQSELKTWISQQYDVLKVLFGDQLKLQH